MDDSLCCRLARTPKWKLFESALGQCGHGARRDKGPHYEKLTRSSYSIVPFAMKGIMEIKWASRSGNMNLIWYIYSWNRGEGRKKETRTGTHIHTPTNPSDKPKEVNFDPKFLYLPILKSESFCMHKSHIFISKSVMYSYVSLTSTFGWCLCSFSVYWSSMANVMTPFPPAMGIPWYAL